MSTFSTFGFHLLYLRAWPANFLHTKMTSESVCSCKGALTTRTNIWFDSRMNSDVALQIMFASKRSRTDWTLTFPSKRFGLGLGFLRCNYYWLRWHAWISWITFQGNSATWIVVRGEPIDLIYRGGWYVVSGQNSWSDSHHIVHIDKWLFKIFG